MKISKKKVADLYSAIMETIMDDRIAIASLDNMNATHKALVDDMLFHLELKIWRKVKVALDLKGPL